MSSIVPPNKSPLSAIDGQQFFFLVLRMCRAKGELVRLSVPKENVENARPPLLRDG